MDTDEKTAAITTMKRALSASIAAALILVSPGLPCYEAVAGQFHKEGPAQVPGQAAKLAKISAAEVKGYRLPPSQISRRAFSLGVTAGVSASKAAAPAGALAKSAATPDAGNAATATAASLQSRLALEEGDSGLLGRLGRLYDKLKLSKDKPSDPGVAAPNGGSSSGNGLSKAGASQAPQAGEKDKVPAPAASAEKLSPIERLKASFRSLKALPGTFYWYVAGYVSNAMGQELLAVGLPVVMGNIFDDKASLTAAGLGLAMRIPGTWLGAGIVQRLNPKLLNYGALIVVALSGWMIPVAARFGVSHETLYHVFLLNNAIGGAVYGITRGMLEQMFPPLILGKGTPEKEQQIKLALNLAYLPVELASLSMAFFAIPLKNKLGGNMLIIIASAMIALAVIPYYFAKFVKPWEKPQVPTLRESFSKAIEFIRGLSKQGRLGQVLKTWARDSAAALKAYAPYNFVRSLHSTVYAATAYILSTAIFHSEAIQGLTITWYDGGSALLSFLASFSLLPKLERSSWTWAGAATAMLFLWTIPLHSATLTLALAGALGGMITIVSNEWGSYYQNTLTEKQLSRFSAWTMTTNTLTVLPIFAAVSASRTFPKFASVLSMANINWGISVAFTAYAAVVLYLTHQQSQAKPKA